VGDEGPEPPAGRARRASRDEAVCQLVLPDLGADVVQVAGAEGKHLVRSLRAAPGESCWATDGRGTRARLEILEVGKGGAAARVAERQCVPQPQRRWWLAAAAAEGRFDWLVEKATELGAWGVAALERGGAAGRRVERWERLARAALGQCLGAYVPRIVGPVGLASLVAAVPGSKTPWAGICVADPGGEAAGELRAGSLAAGDQLLLVGPPEGFAAPELELLQGLKGLRVLRFGPLRLRSETAALAALVWARLGEGPA
jgi:16S rRNA (uracil1498-N3)-methyltransferase